MLIMACGYPSSLWHRTRPMLCTDFRTVALDNRGVGLSDVPSGPYSISTMASDAAAVLGRSRSFQRSRFRESRWEAWLHKNSLCNIRRGRAHSFSLHFAGGPSVVRAERKVSDILMARDMSLEQARAAILPYIYDAEYAARAREIEEDVTLRAGNALPSQEGYTAQLQGILAWEAYSRIAQITAPTLLSTESRMRWCHPATGN